MKKKRFTDAQILSILKQAENGVPVAELCREHGMSSCSGRYKMQGFGGLGQAAAPGNQAKGIKMTKFNAAIHNIPIW